MPTVGIGGGNIGEIDLRGRELEWLLRRGRSTEGGGNGGLALSVVLQYLRLPSAHFVCEDCEDLAFVLCPSKVDHQRRRIHVRIESQTQEHHCYATHLLIRQIPSNLPHHFSSPVGSTCSFSCMSSFHCSLSSFEPS